MGILGAKTVDDMSSNHLDTSIYAGGNDATPALNGALRGFGFCLCFGLVVDPAAGGVIGSFGGSIGVVQRVPYAGLTRWKQ